MEASGEPDCAAILSFGDLVIDFADRRLLYRRRSVDLRRKAWEVLRYLVERRERLVGKDELLDRLWGGTAVTPQVLTNVIRELRRALCDDARQPRWIETVYTQGYRFIGRAENRGRAAARFAPFSGRRQELRQLRAALRSARNGRRRVVFVSGQTRAGKTVLCRRFLASIDAAGTECVAVGHCLEQHRPGEPYMPFLEALETIATAPQTASLLRRYAPTWVAQMPWLGAASGSASGVDASARMLREAAVFFEALGQQGLLVLFLEDLHWADSATVDLIAALAEREARAGLLVVATLCRDHPAARLADSLVRNLTRRGRAEEIALRPPATLPGAPVH